ncbi:alpha-L-rhamnosidase [Rhizobium lusitanum]|uniref:alpha-L-rhamnosidase n=1 Tax=Rhizobium lusitanum TaxID=293958 RepID=UPI001956ABDC|nr:alpha-L-rhamnosidase [Rhizobium lusitanum]MBM7049207.1 family 78 glycoside hydrolase catalytic domain [Rhizobium lusitanum]
MKNTSDHDMPIFAGNPDPSNGQAAVADKHDACRQADTATAAKPDPFDGCHVISPRLEHDLSSGAPRFRKEFTLDREVRSAVLSITALGLFRANINGTPVSEDVIAPGWTDYRYRLLYSQYDVASLLKQGRNYIDVLLGNGWYRGQLGRPARRDLYGPRLGLLAALEVTFADGQTIAIGSDDTWQASSTAIAADDLYDGCVIDYRRHERLLGTDTIDIDRTILKMQSFAGIAVTETLAPVEIIRQQDGSIIIDFGQNIVGWVKLQIRNPSRDRNITVRHAEVLEHGALSTRPLRAAKATDSYYLSGPENTTLEPAFTFHGFRYIGVEGLQEDELEEVQAIVVGSAMRRTGWFSCSDPMLNRLHENVVWSMRGNFLGIPTDCPQRDERLGWTADIQVFAPTASFLFDCTELLDSWLCDLMASQLPDGSVPVVIPDIYRRTSVATAGWGDAATIVPWVLYRHSGRPDILLRQFNSMKRWIDRALKAAGPKLIWSGGHQYGDWLDPTAPPDDPAAAMTDRDLVATACLYRSISIAADVAAVLTLRDEAGRLARLGNDVFERFQATFVTPDGRLTSESQASYAIAISYGLLREHQLQTAGNRLADLVRRAAFTIGTGFLGTPVILDALAVTGHQNVAMRLLNQTECPSWLFPVTMGATTMWERWDSMLPDGSVNPGEMTSFNHYAFGAVADWMHRYLAGLRMESPGWYSFSVTPALWSGLSFAEARFESPAGSIVTRWKYHDNRLDVSVGVPDGATADICLPGETINLSAGRHSFSRIMAPPVEEAGGTLPVTTRQAIDREDVWRRVGNAVGRFRPDWSAKVLARSAWPYLDLPLADLSRCVGLSIPTAEETALRRMLEEIQELCS